MSTHARANSQSYASSYQPPTPTLPTSRRSERSPSPSSRDRRGYRLIDPESCKPPRSPTLLSPGPFALNTSLGNTLSAHGFHLPSPSITIPHRLRHALNPRNLTVVVLWLSLLYFIHRHLLPLPIPSISTLRSRPNTPKGADFLLSTSFPPPPLRAGDDRLDSSDPRYRPFRPLPNPEAPFPRLRPTRFLPKRCMEQWFLDGEMICGKGEVGEEETLDATWLWVNGSDKRWESEMIEWRNREGIYSGEHHFREQNELVYSMRSVLAALGGHLRTFHLITYDFPFTLPNDLDLVSPELVESLQASPGSVDEDGRPQISEQLAAELEAEWRVAQTPTWLDFSRRDTSDPSHPLHPAVGHRDTSDPAARAGAPLSPLPKDPKHLTYPNLRYATHSELFHLPTNDRNEQTEALGEREWKEREWRNKALPTFNSMAIESRVGWLPGLADVSLSLNDDFFILRRHAVSDFHSPLYGNVIRFDHGWYQQVRPILDKSRFNDAGEVGGLNHANYLLSERFPRRLRPYFAHAPKVITRGLHHEASLMFKEALTASSQRKFRELSMGEGDVQMQWLLTSLRVERWREALLWTYVVANLGAADPNAVGVWSDYARKRIQDLFGLNTNGEDDDVAMIEVHRGERWTLELGRMEKMLGQAGWEQPRATRFLFSSLDGHMPPILRDGVDPEENNKCFFDLDRCLGAFWHREQNTTAADMFKRLAFQSPECGDCLIMALVTSSGPLGLSEFFPPAETIYENAPLAEGKRYPKYLQPPHLPLTSTWQAADFSLEHVMTTTALPGEEVNMREYSMKLLSRYLYISATSDSHFHMLKDPQHANTVFQMIQANPQVSILGLNDNIERGYDATKEIMGVWFNMRWPKKAIWERGWDPVKDRLDERD